MAHTKSAGTTKLGRDSRAKRLGVKLYAGQHADAGKVLIRQRGTKFYPGENVRRGGDDTLYATASGVISFTTKPKRSFTSKKRTITLVNVVPQ